MINLNLFSISGLLIVITHLPLLILLIIKGKNKLARIYTLSLASVLIWGIGSFLVGITRDAKLAYGFLKFAYCGVIFIPVFVQHTALLLIGKKSKLIITFIYTQAIFFLFANLTGHLSPTTKLVFNSFYYYVSTDLFLWSFIFWVSIVFLCHYQLIRYYQKFHPNDRKLLLFLYGTGLGFLGGLNNFLPVFDIYVYPYGNLIVPIYTFLITYAIFKYHFFDINLVISKSIVYSMLLTLITLLYLLIVISSEKFLAFFLGYKSIAISIGTAFVLGLLFVPLRNKIQKIVDKVFYHATQAEILHENILLRQEVAQTDKLKAIATLASGMAHEIKNPLTAIRTFAEYLPQKLNDREFLRKFSKIIGQEVNRIDGLVNQLLEFAKPSPLNLQEINIHKLLSDTINFLNSEFLKHKIKIIKEFSANGEIYLYVDRNQLRQAFLNIILNSIEAMPEGGVLTVKTLVKAPPNPSSLNPNSGIIISIQDTGSGIAPKDLPHIFDPFFSTKDHGTGLGLSITHEIIKKHGGEIRMESAVGKGTTFEIELPIHRENTLNGDAKERAKER